MDLAAFANTVLSLFVIVDPVGCLPVFAAITRARRGRSGGPPSGGR
jgi:small neutral amino acid transporter SnatA (MarC family)